MDLAIQPEFYTATIDNHGNYVDYIPSFQMKNGIRCMCGSRKDKIYNNSNAFITHTKSQTHKSWIEYLNNNKMNYFKENREMKDIIHNQKIIIGNYEKDILSLKAVIEHLEKKKEVLTSIDLLDF
jgi:CRISPR/Cas system CMR-associated protein Cmr5 small subunit